MGIRAETNYILLWINEPRQQWGYFPVSIAIPFICLISYSSSESIMRLCFDKTRTLSSMVYEFAPVKKLFVSTDSHWTNGYVGFLILTSGWLMIAAWSNLLTNTDVRPKKYRCFCGTKNQDAQRHSSCSLLSPDGRHSKLYFPVNFFWCRTPIYVYWNINKTEH